VIAVRGLLAGDLTHSCHNRLFTIQKALEKPSFIP